MQDVIFKYNSEKHFNHFFKFPPASFFLQTLAFLYCTPSCRTCFWCL